VEVAVIDGGEIGADDDEEGAKGQYNRRRRRQRLLICWDLSLW